VLNLEDGKACVSYNELQTDDGKLLLKVLAAGGFAYAMGISFPCALKREIFERSFLIMHVYILAWTPYDNH
jgi:hypothetical protein